MNTEYNPARNRAKGLLKHYLSQVYLAAGLRWDGDMNAEIDGLVDDLIEAAAAEIEAERQQ